MGGSLKGIRSLTDDTCLTFDCGVALGEKKLFVTGFANDTGLDVGLPELRM